MTIIKAQQITDDNIKCRWEEPYVSSAINRQLSAFPRGVYRGFKVEEMSPVGTGVSVSPDTYNDSYLLHENLATGFKVAVRYDAAFNVDGITLAAGFVNGVDYYIWVDVTYLVSSASSGYVRVGTAADLAAAPNAIPIASFNVASGTDISNADISQSAASSPVEFLTPVPDASESNFWGMLDETRFGYLPASDQKDAMDAASPAPNTGNPFLTDASLNTTVWATPSSQVVTVTPPSNQCQLTGFFYVGLGGVGTPNKWFQLMDPLSNNGLTDDADGSQCVVAAVYDNTNNHPLDPSGVDSGDVDANGFYENPIIQFSNTLSDVGQTSVGVWCGEKGVYGSLPNTAFILENSGIRVPTHQSALEQMKQNWDRRPITLTIDAEGDTLANYSGANALYAALVVLGNSTGGTIFVRKGDYTLSSSVTTTKPVKIICEGSGQVSGERCRITIQAGGSLTFNGPVEIHGLDIEVDHHSTTPLVKFNAGDTSVYDTYCSGAMAIDASSRNYVFERLHCSLDNTSSVFCFAVGHTTAGVVAQNVRFTDCLFSGETGTGAAGGFDGNGPGTGLLWKATFEGCEFTGRGAYPALVISGYWIDIKRCHAFSETDGGTQSLNAMVQITVLSGAEISASDFTLQMTSAGANINRPALAAVCGGNNSAIHLSNIGVSSESNKPLDISTSTGFVFLDAGGSSEDGTLISVDGMQLQNLEPAIASDEGDVVAVQADAKSARVNIRGLVMEDFSAATVNSWLRAVVLRGTGQGSLLLEGCTLDGDSLTSSANQNFVGICADNSYGALSAPGGITVRNSIVKGFEVNDILIESSTRITLDGVRGDGDSLSSGAGSRWLIYSDEAIVTNCWFTNDIQSLAILYFQSTADRPIVSNNHLYETVGGASTYAIFATSAIGAGTFIGNVGIGNAQSYTNSNHLGWGDSVSVPANQSPYILNVGFTVTVT